MRATPAPIWPDPDAGASSDEWALPRVVDAFAGEVVQPGDLSRAFDVEGCPVVPVAPAVVSMAHVRVRLAAAQRVRQLEEAVTAGPSGETVRLLEQVDVGLLGPADRAAVLRAAEACVAWLQSVSLRVTAAVADAHVAVQARAEDDLARTAARRGASVRDDSVLARQLAQESAAADVAGALRIARRSAVARVQAACALRDRLPLLADQLARGRTSLLHVFAAVDATHPLVEPAAREAVDARAAELAARLPVGAFRSRMRALVLGAEPEQAARRHREAVARRGVAFWPQDDGMATVAATLPAPEARAVWLTLDAEARARREADPKGLRCLDALRADALVALAAAARAAAHAGTGSAGAGAGARASRGGAAPSVELGVVVDLPTLLGLQDNPGHLAGHGPIPAELVRRLAADAAWRRLVSDPLSGALLDASPHRYRPGRRLRRFLDLRDGGCTAPGCSVGARDCDADHVLPFADGGPTIRANLALASRRDHHLHTLCGWRVTRDEVARTTVWTTPFGMPYARPDPPVLPHLDRSPPADPDDPPF